MGVESNPQLCLQEVNSSEDFVGGLVSTSSIPPSFDDALVVAIDSEVFDVGVSFRNCRGEKFKSDCFGPADVSAICLPALNQDPSSPFVSNGDSNAS